MKKKNDFLAAALVAAIVLAPSFASAKTARQPASVAEALTGDSVRLKGGKILRYAGLQAPPRQSVVPLLREYGEASYEFNRSLVEGKDVEIEWDSQIRDKRGDLLGYVFLKDGTFVNRAVLEAGHAKVAITPPNARHEGKFREAELAARRERLGQWREEPKNPFLKNDFLGDPSTKTFYLPNSPELERIPAGHLVTFRSRVDATAAGYRPCDSCKRDAPEEI